MNRSTETSTSSRSFRTGNSKGKCIEGKWLEVGTAAYEISRLGGSIPRLGGRPKPNPGKTLTPTIRKREGLDTLKHSTPTR
ncbi:conserved hypothetical protein [Ricinus communis]|uniref:Uncharacterized protein n=1 Tax=Ricinus communis TaxID=3988 RepID=B9T902_RICCO|nr:conserved hypothetical protein [Ricinus communis]